MSNFPKKSFLGITYDFGHLKPINQQLAINAAKTVIINLNIKFGCHCFTEGFKYDKHSDHHRYVYQGELRAFDQTRYECSFQLPQVIQSMLTGRVFNAQNSFTYMALLKPPNLANSFQSYSVFFDLKKHSLREELGVKMFVKSAYLRNYAAKANAQSWRFVSLAGKIAGVIHK